MNVWLVSPAWRRFPVTCLALAQRAWLCRELAVRGLTANSVIVADDENLEIAQEFGFVGLYQNNDFLGRKFNDGIEWACRHGDADVVVLIGSDDWMHEDAFDRLPLPVSEMRVPTDLEPCVVGGGFDPEIVAGRKISLVDLETGRARVCEARNRHGVIPWLIHRKALEPSGFRPVNDMQQKGTDGSLIAGLGCPVDWVFHDPAHDWARVDFKSSVNLNSYDLIAGAIGSRVVDDPWAELAEHYPRELVKRARNLSLETLWAAA